MATMPFVYTGASGQINYVGIIERIIDLNFSSSGSPTFSTGLTFAQKQFLLPEVSGMPGLYQKSLDVTPWLDSEYVFSVHDSGTQLCLGATNFYLREGVECGPSGNTNLIWDEPLRNHLQNGSTASGLSKAQEDIYFSNVKLTVGDNNQNDVIAASWYKNNLVLPSSCLSSPCVSVFRTNDGAALIQNGIMSYSSPTLSSVYYTSSVPNLFASGVPYLVQVSGVIDNLSRIWTNLVGIDIL